MRTSPSPICYVCTIIFAHKLLFTVHVVDREVSALCELEHLRQLDLMGTRNVSCAVVKELLERRSDQGLGEILFCQLATVGFSTGTLLSDFLNKTT